MGKPGHISSVDKEQKVEYAEDVLLKQETNVGLLAFSAFHINREHDTPNGAFSKSHISIWERAWELETSGKGEACLREEKLLSQIATARGFPLF